MTEPDEQYRLARQRVHRLRGFYVHVIVYLAVNALLFAINLLTPGPLWFYWPLLGWGIGLIAHGLTLSGFAFLGPEWEQRKIREYMNREKPPSARPPTSEGH